MIAIAILGFLGLSVLFLFQSESGYPMGAYPLGWLLGSIAEIGCFLTLVYMSDSLFSRKNSAHPITSTLALLSAGLRLFIYAAVLLVSAICTFKSEWFGGFNAFNFYTTAAGLLPMLVVVFLTQFFALKKESAAPQGSGAVAKKEAVQPLNPEKKDESQGDKK